MREDRLDRLLAERQLHAESRSRRPFRLRRVALGGADRHPSAPAISSKLKSNACLSTTTFACAGEISARRARRAGAQPGGSAAWPVGVARLAAVLVERLAAPRLALRDVATGVHDEAVQPGRERRLAAELGSFTQSRERVLRRVARVLAVAQQVVGEPLDARGVPLAERRQARRSPSFALFTRIGSLSLS